MIHCQLSGLYVVYYFTVSKMIALGIWTLMYSKVLWQTKFLSEWNFLEMLCMLRH